MGVTRPTMEITFHVATIVSTDAATATVGEWCGLGFCVSAALFARVLLAVGSGALAVFALVALSFIPEARAVCQRELERTRDEARAFKRFARRVVGIEPAKQRIDMGPGTVLLTDGPQDDRLNAVRTAYRETVMAVAHYAEEYDEPLEQNLEAEFGPELANALRSHPQLEEPVKGALVESATDAAADREGFTRTVERELESLDHAADTLQSIEAELDGYHEAALHRYSFDELREAWDVLGEYESDCTALAAARQAEMHRRAEYDAFDLHDYLYQDTQTRHPVLADAAETAEAVQAARKRVAHALAMRV
jgi:hypothetical protein